MNSERLTVRLGLFPEEVRPGLMKYLFADDTNLLHADKDLIEVARKYNQHRIAESL